MLLLIAINQYLFSELSLVSPLHPPRVMIQRCQVYYDGYGYDHLGFKDKLPIGPRSGVSAIDIATRNDEGSCLKALQEVIQPARQHAALTADVERVRSDKYNASIVETSMRKF